MNLTRRAVLALGLALAASRALADITQEDAVLRVTNPSGAAPDIALHLEQALLLEIGNRRVFRSIRGETGAIEVLVAITGSHRPWQLSPVRLPAWIRMDVQVKRAGVVVDTFRVSHRAELMGLGQTIDVIIADAAADVARRIQTDLG